MNFFDYLDRRNKRKVLLTLINRFEKKSREESKNLLYVSEVTYSPQQELRLSRSFVKTADDYQKTADKYREQLNKLLE